MSTGGGAHVCISMSSYTSARSSLHYTFDRETKDNPQMVLTTPIKQQNIEKGKRQNDAWAEAKLLFLGREGEGIYRCLEFGFEIKCRLNKYLI